MNNMKFTKDQLLKLNPCEDGLGFAESCGFDFAKIYATCERGDWLIWLLRKSGAINKHQSVFLACECAEHVLQIFEKKYPKDKRPRAAIDAAREWAKNPTEENRVKLKPTASAAAYAASSAAADAYADASDASAAAYASASAAYAAAAYAASSAAAAADAYAAYASYASASASASASAAYAAAAYAAYAAYASYAASRNIERKWQAEKIHEIIPNPFL